MPIAERLSFTSSSLNGLMIASTFFMRSSALWTSLDFGSSILARRHDLGWSARPAVVPLPFDFRMMGIRIDNEPELKIEDAMQVKGRWADRGNQERSQPDYESQSENAA